MGSIFFCVNQGHEGPSHEGEGDGIVVNVASCSRGQVPKEIGYVGPSLEV